MKNSAEKLSGEKKSVIIFDVKLLSIFNIKLHSCWVIWLLNKYMVMPGALMSIICSVHVPWIKMLWIFHHFRLVFIFAASFRFWIKEFASNEQWTMHSQPPNPKRTIKLLEKQRSNRWWLHFVRECDRFGHIIFTMNATVTSFDYLSFPFFLPFSRWKLTLMHFWSTSEPSSDRRQFWRGFSKKTKDIHRMHNGFTVARRLVKCSIVS